MGKIVPTDSEVRAAFFAQLRDALEPNMPIEAMARWAKDPEGLRTAAQSALMPSFPLDDAAQAALLERVRRAKWHFDDSFTASCRSLMSREGAFDLHKTLFLLGGAELRLRSGPSYEDRADYQDAVSVAHEKGLDLPSTAYILTTLATEPELLTSPARTKRILVREWQFSGYYSTICFGGNGRLLLMSKTPILEKLGPTTAIPFIQRK